MEKYYIVTDECKLRKDYLDYMENAKLINEYVKKFMQDNDIETTIYYPANETLYIEPTENDRINFKGILKTPNKSGLSGFKKSSKLNKEWIKLLKDNNLKVLYKPFVGSYFEFCAGKMSSRLFEIKNVVYCSFNNDYNFKNPKGMIEIKASEFYKIIENEEE